MNNEDVIIPDPEKRKQGLRIVAVIAGSLFILTAYIVFTMLRYSSVDANNFKDACDAIEGITRFTVWIMAVIGFPFSLYCFFVGLRSFKEACFPPSRVYVLRKTKIRRGLKAKILGAFFATLGALIFTLLCYGSIRATMLTKAFQDCRAYKPGSAKFELGPTRLK